jgi:hypothetical protein
MFSFSDNTAASEYVAMGASAGNKTMLNNADSTILGTTTVTDAFHIFAFTFQNGECNVLHYIDGEFQRRAITLRSRTEGQFLDAFGITNASIGKLVKSSGTTFSGLQLKDFAISPEPLGQIDLAKSLKYLADTYSITLVNYYQ